MTGKNKKHKLSGVPTAYEESQKVVDSKNIEKIKENIDILEKQRQRDELAILELSNTHRKSKVPLVDQLSIEQITYQQALQNLLNLKSTETLESIMLLYEYMEKQKTFKLDKLTGTELLKLGKYKGIRQIHRNNILRRIESNLNLKIKVLDPEESIKNYKNKNTNKGLVYKYYELIKVDKVVYSKKNPKLIKELVGVEFLPEYIKHIHLISKRYLPLESIRRIDKDSSTDKSRYFLYKLCFKFAGMKKEECQFTLEECMNLGKFFSRSERNLKKKWKPIEKALIRARKLRLLQFKWTFKEIPDTERNKFKTNLFGEITEGEYQEDETLKDEYYKYIKVVEIIRIYHLNAPQIDLPFALEKQKTIRKITAKF